MPCYVIFVLQLQQQLPVTFFCAQARHHSRWTETLSALWWRQQDWPSQSTAAQSNPHQRNHREHHIQPPTRHQKEKSNRICTYLISGIGPRPMNQLNTQAAHPGKSYRYIGIVNARRDTWSNDSRLQAHDYHLVMEMQPGRFTKAMHT